METTGPICEFETHAKSRSKNRVFEKLYCCHGNMQRQENYHYFTPEAYHLV